MSPYGTCATSPGSGANGACLAGWPVSASEPIVRPWKAPLGGNEFRAAGQPGDLEGDLVGLGAGVAEEHPRGVGAQQPDERLGQRDARFGGVEVRRVARAC